MRLLRLLMGGWVLATLLVLVGVLSIPGGPSGDVEGLILVGLMTMLTLPLGLVAYFVGLFVLSEIDHAVKAATGHYFTTSYASLILLWLIFFVAGCVQWFGLWLWLRRRK